MLLILAFGLGFVGYLPLGNINLTVVQLSLSSQKGNGQGFIAFAALMEFLYCLCCLYGLDLLLGQPRLVVMMEWCASIIFLLLGIASFLHRDKPEAEAQQRAGLRRGILIAIFNPLQIPFWMGWGVYLLQNNWLKGDLETIIIFSTVCALGTVAILYLYSIAGKKIVEKLNIQGKILNRFIGSFFLLLAAYEAFKALS